MSITQAPEPSDVQFEHIQFNAWNLAARSLLTGILKYATIIIGFGIISFAAGWNVSVTATSTATTGSPTCATCAYRTPAGAMNLTTSQATDYKQCFDNNFKFANSTSCGNVSRCYEYVIRRILIRSIYRVDSAFTLRHAQCHLALTNNSLLIDYTNFVIMSPLSFRQVLLCRPVHHRHGCQLRPRVLLLRLPQAPGAGHQRHGHQLAGHHGHQSDTQIYQQGHKQL